MAGSRFPDPAQGVFTTTLVRDGVPLALDAHLARLDASVRALYAVGLPADAPEVAGVRTRGVALGRLRLSAVPRPGGALRLDAVVAPVEPAAVLPGWERALLLRTVGGEDWPAAHKWADRRVLAALEARTAPAGALLTGPGGALRETTRANLFVVDAVGVLRTPPAGGTILPGVMRARVLALAAESGVVIREAPLTAAELPGACEAFATGSVRGVEPVRAIDDRSWEAPGPVTRLLADALRRTWLGA